MPRVDGEPMKPLRVLVADDDDMLATLLAEVLTDMGHDVCAVEATEPDTVAAAARCKPDVMLVDVTLGEGSGIAAVQQVLRSGFVAHVFVTGNATRLLARCPQAVVLRKPFREEDIAPAIQRALDAGAAR
jgi:CheY-like chemotaxis protein